MRRLHVMPLILTAFLAPLTLAAPPPNLEREGYTELVFEENFDGPIDEAKWDVNNWETAHGEPFEVRFHPDAVDVADGELTLRVFERNPGERRLERKRFRAGKIQTRTWHRERFEATYGYVESRIQFNSRPGGFGAFWLHSRYAQAGRRPAPGVPDIDYAVEWNDPDRFLREAGAEIDIVEALAEHWERDENGNRRYVDFRNRWVINIHWNGYRDNRDKWEPGQLHKAVGVKSPLSARQGNIVGDWHVYGLHWTPHHYGFYLDGELVWQTTQGVSQMPEFILLSIHAMDGKFAGNIPREGFGGRGSNKNPTMKVDWVRWYQSPEQKQADEQRRQNR